ncbi:PAS domain S-box protein [Natranaerofaba carboxydovora]|uniref:sensor domain-containing diguanylate cyclase/phosphohydrolase n=1 Tax=Natranaerofaba carboxydovora TaxID=2742683 RepID=UPI001F14907D|nr:PAS domain S-box protein [Natranaerofaba carboxydovora]UMZ74342.1 Cyclic di-GMP phosphodiesterase response regulator RpfG [Natranaerofaba carboxydovora]
MSNRNNKMQAILNSLNANICLLDEKGYIEEVNKSWEQFAKDNGINPEKVGPGVNYIDVCDRVEGDEMDSASQFARGVRAVINGEIDFFELEYSCHSPDTERWFVGRVTPYIGSISSSKRKVVIVHENITGKKVAEQKQHIQKELDIKGQAIESSINAVALVNTEGKITYVNPSFLELLGYEDEDEVLGTILSDYWHEEEKAKNIIENLFREGSWSGDLAIKRKDGQMMEVNLSASLIYTDEKSKEHSLITIVATFIDITERKKTEKSLIRFRNALDSSADNIFIIDYPSFKLLDVNKTACIELGYSKNELLELTPFDIKSKISNEELKEKFYQSMKYSDVTFETYHCRKDGNVFPIEISIRYSDLPYEKWFVVTSRNISERKKVEEKLLYLSYHDDLTGLYNRSFLEEEKKRLDVNRNLPISVIMADVNGLKLVNDTYGHKVGDELLVRAGEILKKTCRKDDIIVRWGGDEFVIFLPQTDKEEAKEILTRIKKESENFQVESLPVRIALGSATKRNTYELLEDAFKRAEDRMYQNKLTESNSARSNIISALLGTLKEKSDETEEHAWRMTELSFKFGEVLDLCAEDLDKLSLLATMHDIGKVVISEEVLKKPGKLTKDEWEKIKEHPETGQRIARTSESLIYISEEILSHHERWDGKGYPYGLKGEEIPYLARIIAIIDAYDVMTNGRSYKKRMSKDEALDEIKACAGTQFDPNLAVAFEKMMR